MPRCFNPFFYAQGGTVSPCVLKEFQESFKIVGELVSHAARRDAASLLADADEDRANLFRTQGFCVIFANVKRTGSPALPARHE
jgi:hypothetical protein